MTTRAGVGGEDRVLNLLRGSGPLPPPGDAGWEALARECAAEGLAGSALTLLERAGRVGDLPRAARDLLEAEVNRVRVAQTILFHRFEALARRLGEAGVELIVHKGGVLAHEVYPRPEDRPMVDVDIIFRPRQWEPVRDLLMAGGYRLPNAARQEFWLENYFNLSIGSPEDPPSAFDLHWSLAHEGRYHVETEELFTRAVPFRLGETRLLRLSNEDLLLGLFLHLAYHYFESRLIWLYDMKLAIQSWPIAWDLLLDRAARWGLLAVAAFNVEFLEKVLPGTVPRSVRARARAGGLRRSMARPLLSPSPRRLFRGEQNRLNQFVLGLLAIDRPADAARFAAGKVYRSLRWVGRRPRRR